MKGVMYYEKNNSQSKSTKIDKVKEKQEHEDKSKRVDIRLRCGL